MPTLTAPEAAAIRPTLLQRARRHGMECGMRMAISDLRIANRVPYDRRAEQARCMRKLAWEIARVRRADASLSAEGA